MNSGDRMAHRRPGEGLGEDAVQDEFWHLDAAAIQGGLEVTGLADVGRDDFAQLNKI